MFSDKQAIEVLHGILQHRDKWYLDSNVIEILEIDDPGQKACMSADRALGNLSINQLYSRYKLWRDNPILAPNVEYFDNFLNHVAWDLARKSLRGTERDYFEDNINITIHFI